MVMSIVIARWRCAGSVPIAVVEIDDSLPSRPAS
jgi:hypothetical protein